RKLSGEGEPKLEGLADVPTERSVPTSLVIRRAGGFYASVIGFYLLVTLFGFHIAIPLFLISFLRFYGNARWPLVIGLTASVLLVTVGIFDQLLHIPWPEPLLKALLSPATP
ncbi:MAG: hypothetical protein GTO40_00395, partial [Deltaproteobacteria bacterium]|nr:hypothetical protein [Deltaproteobacteria bacterium]